MSGLKSLTPKTIPQLKQGRYIVGVSGGVDSIVLLDLLAQQPGVKLIIAHFDHGIREDSAQDALFVQKVAEKYDLSFVAERGDLGRHASEAEARRARYAFFNKLIIQFEADALITAHHQDDLIETAIINMLRGTGWRGISSLRNAGALNRPLLDISKKEIIAYANSHELTWHEDSTNVDQTYLRNYIRHNLVPLAQDRNAAFRKHLLAMIDRQNSMRNEIEQTTIVLLDTFAVMGDDEISLPRTWLIMLPDGVLKEVLRAAVQRLTGKGTEKQAMIRIVHFVKSAGLYKMLQVHKGLVFVAQRGRIVVRKR